MPSVKTETAVMAPAAAELRYSDSPPPSKDVQPPIVPNYLEDPVLHQVYCVGSFLGKGGFAWCYEATEVQTQAVYALKVVPKSRLTKPHHTEKVMREITIHYPLSHKHVVRLYSAFEDSSNIYMVLEYCPLQSLVHILKKRGYLCEEEVRYYMRQLIAGVRYLHEECSVLHRDLKLGNMLLTQDMCVKIADFGLAMEFGGARERTVTLCGTPNYIAPEILKKQGYSFATEAWAVGCIMYAMLVGSPPFETNSLEETYGLIMECKYSVPDSISFNAKDLIRLLLHPDPSRRSLSVDILNHAFFADGFTPYSLSPDCAVYCPSFIVDSYTYAANRKPLSIANNAACTLYAAGDSKTTTTTINRNNNAIKKSSHDNGAAMITVYDSAYGRSTPRKTVDSTAKLQQPSTSSSPDSSNKVAAIHKSCSSSAAWTSSSSYSAGSSRSSKLSSAFRTPTPPQQQQFFPSTVVAPPSVESCTMNPNFVPGNYQSVATALIEENLDMCGHISTVLKQLRDSISSMIVLNKSDPTSVYATNYIPKLVPGTGIVYVTKWIDYSNRQGFGVQYNNGVVSVMFNDDCSLMLDADRRTGRFLPADSKKAYCKGETYFDVTQICDNQEMMERVHAVNVFASYMDRNLINAGDDNGYSSGDLTKVPYAIYWRRYVDSIVMVFSDGTFQVNFTDSHIKLVLSPTYVSSDFYLLTYINAARNACTYSLSSLIHLLRHSDWFGTIFLRVCELLMDARSCLVFR